MNSIYATIRNVIGIKTDKIVIFRTIFSIRFFLFLIIHFLWEALPKKKNLTLDPPLVGISNEQNIRLIKFVKLIKFVLGEMCKKNKTRETFKRK